MAMTTNFTLNNDGAPAYKKDTPAIWLGPTKAAINRQKVFAVLQKDITVVHSIDSLMAETGLTRKQVYVASRVLCLKGFGFRKDNVEVVISGDRQSYKRTINIQGRDLMGKKEPVQW